MTKSPLGYSGAVTVETKIVKSFDYMQASLLIDDVTYYVLDVGEKTVCLEAFRSKLDG